MIPKICGDSRSLQLMHRSSGNKRWIILALLFFATALNYIDRQVISLLKPTLSEELNWSEMDYADIVFYFQLAYTIGFVSVGRLLDVVGTKKGFFACVGLWSLACAAHGLARTVSGFSVARFFLGLAEPGNFSGCLKAVRMWFPRSERGFAIGVYNAATNVGAMTAPFLIPWITVGWGWPWAFYVTGALGFVWLLAWVKFYHSLATHPTVTEAERTYIQAEPDPPTHGTIPFRTILRLKTTWAFSLGNLVPITIFWFYLFWLPDFLAKTHGIRLMALGLPLMVIYVGACVGSIAGGSLSSWFISRGMNVLAARKLAMLATVFFIAPIALAPQIDDLWGCTIIVTVAVAAHQGWTVNIWSLVTDTLPERAVGSVFGFGGMLGSIVGMGLAKAIGYTLQITGSYYAIFISIPTIYVLSLAALHILMPKKPESIG